MVGVNVTFSAVTFLVTLLNLVIIGAGIYLFYLAVKALKKYLRS